MLANSHASQSSDQRFFISIVLHYQATISSLSQLFDNWHTSITTPNVFRSRYIDISASMMSSGMNDVGQKGRFSTYNIALVNCFSQIKSLLYILLKRHCAHVTNECIVSSRA